MLAATENAAPSSAHAELYPLTSDGLARMVKDSQVGFLKKYDGPHGLASQLGAKDTSQGLPSGFDFEAQRELYGKNFFDPPKVATYLELLWNGLHDVTLIMLIMAAVVSLILGLGFEEDKSTAWVEGAAILVTVLVVLNVQAGTDYSKASQFRKQREEIENTQTCVLLRDGVNVTVHPREIVVGDILQMKIGDIVPADGVLVEGWLKMDEAALTGESKLIKKSTKYDYHESDMDSHGLLPETPFVLSGTSMMDGTGRMVVVAVGRNSVQGKILAAVGAQDAGNAAKTLSEDEMAALKAAAEVDEVDDDMRAALLPASGNNNDAPRPSGLERFSDKISACCKSFWTFGDFDTGGSLMEKLDTMAMDVGKIGILVATVVFFVMCIRWSVTEFARDGSCKDFSVETCNEAKETFGCEWKSDECVRFWRGAADVEFVLNFFITAVTILVVAIPEGLPLAVTLSLAVTMRKMIKDHNRVKHMDSCETMGSATTICSDKTGTLTQNAMTVMRVVFFDSKGEAAVVAHDPSTNKSVGEVAASRKEEFDSDLFKSLAEAVCLDSSPTSNVRETETVVDLGVNSSGDATKTYAYEGNATECALLKLSVQLGFEPPEVRKTHSNKGGSLPWGVANFPFTSSRKRMSWIIPKSDGTFRLYSKGAPSYIFDECSFVANASELSANPKAFNEGARSIAEDAVSELQGSAMRAIAIAYKDFDYQLEPHWRKYSGDLDPESGEPPANAVFDAEKDLTLLAVTGIEDPLRPSVIKAIQQCNNAGVDVRMCTGDALATAVAIALQCGILRERDLQVTAEHKKLPKKFFAMTGAEFDERVHVIDDSAPKIKRRTYDFDTGEVGEKLRHPFLLDDQNRKIINQRVFDEIWPKLRVLARCQPEDKLALVQGMRASTVFKQTDYVNELFVEHGIKIFPDHQVVAVTGDGTNDAPALKAADVGFAMGIVGTSIAKQACDILLTDDNFASIVLAVKWGRNVFDSISKFIQFQLTVNICAITLAVIGAFAFNQSPLGAVQMLWVNMIMDSLASLALATEPPTEVLLERPPYGRRRPILSRVMLFNMFGQAFFQLAILFAVLFDSSWLPHNNDGSPVEKYPPPMSSDPHPEEDPHGASSVHWTIVFNTFVFFQIFNEFNSRKLQTVERLKESWSEWNVFEGVFDNPVFVTIVFATALLQVVIVQFGGITFSVLPLNAKQWGFCAGVGLCSLFNQFLINALLVGTDPIFKKWEVKKRELLFDDEERALAGARRVGENGEEVGGVDGGPALDDQQKTAVGGGGNGSRRSHGAASSDSDREHRKQRTMERWKLVRRTVVYGAAFKPLVSSDQDVLPGLGSLGASGSGRAGSKRGRRKSMEAVFAPGTSYRDFALQSRHDFPHTKESSNQLDRQLSHVGRAYLQGSGSKRSRVSSLEYDEDESEGLVEK